MNILLITCDQWRGDSVGYAGHPLVKTPNVDALAADGVAFLNHYAQAAPCAPARACLYTGLYQMNTRAVRNGTPLSQRFDNVARLARRAGYDPTLFGYTDVGPDPTVLDPADPALTEWEGVLPGITPRVRLPEHEKAWLSWLRTQGLELHDQQRAHLPAERPGEITNAPPLYDKDQTQTAFITGEFIRWLTEQDGDRPWFAHISHLRPHPPFVVPAPYNTMFAPAAVDGFIRQKSPAAEAATHPLMDFALRFTKAQNFVHGIDKLVRDLTEAEFRQIKATYYGMIAEVDLQLGRAFDAIKARGDWDDTLVIFTSDHAEMMGNHYALGKGGYFDGSQHIPLVIRDPRGSARGEKIAAFTESIDIFATLLEAIGGEPLHRPDGHSLSPWLNGTTPKTWRDAVHWEFDFRDVAGQTAERWFGLTSTQCNMSVIRTQKWKYVHFAALPPLLFDLEADPGELSNIAADPAYAAVRLEMAERLLAWRAEHLDQTLALMDVTPNGVVKAPFLR